MRASGHKRSRREEEKAVGVTKIQLDLPPAVSFVMRNAFRPLFTSLAARSPLFRTQFEHEMLLSLSGNAEQSTQALSVAFQHLPTAFFQAWVESALSPREYLKGKSDSFLILSLKVRPGFVSNMPSSRTHGLLNPTFSQHMNIHNKLCQMYFPMCLMGTLLRSHSLKRRFLDY